jgi:hypothetical protein
MNNRNVKQVLFGVGNQQMGGGKRRGTKRGKNGQSTVEPGNPKDR